jgi:hypothetical protein
MYIATVFSAKLLLQKQGTQLTRQPSPDTNHARTSQLPQLPLPRARSAAPQCTQTHQRQPAGQNLQHQLQIQQQQQQADRLAAETSKQHCHTPLDTAERQHISCGKLLGFSTFYIR